MKNSYDTCKYISNEDMFLLVNNAHNSNLDIYTIDNDTFSFENKDSLLRIKFNNLNELRELFGSLFIPQIHLNDSYNNIIVFLYKDICSYEYEYSICNNNSDNKTIIVCGNLNDFDIVNSIISTYGYKQVEEKKTHIKSLFKKNRI